MVDFKPCDYEKGWVKTEYPIAFPWKLFFEYYDYVYKKKTYYKRVNRLDGLFDWICRVYHKIRYD